MVAEELFLVSADKLICQCHCRIPRIGLPTARHKAIIGGEETSDFFRGSPVKLRSLFVRWHMGGGVPGPGFC